MTIQLYTQIMVGRKPIVIFYDALVSVQSHFKRRCKQGYGDSGANFICAMREKSAHPNYDNGIFYLTEVGRAAHVKMFLIQIEPRRAGYGITEVGHPRLLIDNLPKQNKSQNSNL